MFFHKRVSEWPELIVFKASSALGNHHAGVVLKSGLLKGFVDSDGKR